MMPQKNDFPIIPAKDFLEALANPELHAALKADGFKINWKAVADAMGLPNLIETIPQQIDMMKTGSLGQWPPLSVPYPPTVFPGVIYPYKYPVNPTPNGTGDFQPPYDRLTVCQTDPQSSVNDATGDSTSWGSYPPAMKDEGPTSLVNPRVSGVDPDDLPF